MRKLLLVFLFLLGICYINAQVTPKTVQYYLEIPISTNVPKMKLTMINGKTAISLEFKNKTITDLFKKFKISDFKLAFPGGKSELLQSAYIIECDPKLMEMIANKYPDVFGRFEVIEPIQPLYIPNDIGVTSGNSSMEQPELNFINAPQAWDISKGNNNIIGIAEGVNVAQEDLVGKSVNIQGGNPSSTSMEHGTQVALIAGANTDNNKGIASIGFNSNVKASSSGYSGLIPLANSGVRVINMSWGSCNILPLSSQYGQAIMDQVYNSGVVLVAAAGNGSWSCSSYGPSIDHYPASLNHVISVTNVGHQYDIGTPNIEEKLWKDVFLQTLAPFYATYNVNVDLSAPGRNILTGADYVNGVAMYKYDGGTSFSAPMVTGTIGLMFGINTCLFPDEVESILKLTAVKNDLLPQNILYKGLIGAGRLDAYEAVKMAKDMSLPFGVVIVKDRIIDRWDFNLRTNPYAIKMSNNLVSNTATVNFTSRDNIEVLSGDYAPATGYVDLKINTSNTVCNIPTNISTSQSKIKNIKESNVTLNKIQLYPNPNKGDFTINLGVMPEANIAISIYDIEGILVFSTLANSSIFKINLPHLPSGLYLVKLQGDNYDETLKFIKE